MSAGIACPHCGSRRSVVADTRQSNHAIRRRRHCRNCKQRYTTYESHALTIPSELHETLKKFVKQTENFLTDTIPYEEIDYQFVPKQGMVVRAKH
jgi:transcriptional regulator NrdR family protein